MKPVDASPGDKAPSKPHNVYIKTALERPQQDDDLRPQNGKSKPCPDVKPLTKKVQMSPLSQSIRKKNESKKLSRDSKMVRKLKDPKSEDSHELDIFSTEEPVGPIDERTAKVLQEAEALLGIKKTSTPQTGVEDTPEGQFGEATENESSTTKGGTFPQRDVTGVDDKLPEHLAKEIPNDQEWENEIARNILTLYSVSLKAGGGSDATQSDSPQRRPQDASPGSSREEATSPKKAGREEVVAKDSSLPSIRFKGQVGKGWIPSHVEEDGTIVINVPDIPQHIWFSGAGSIKAVWCGLADEAPALEELTPNMACGHRICIELRNLEATGQTRKYATIVEALLVTRLRSRKVTDLDIRQWRQLAVTCTAFSTRFTDAKNFNNALEMLKKAEELKENAVLDEGTQEELAAFVADAYSYYYYRRGKANAALQFTEKATRIHQRRGEMSHLAKCNLHVGAILSRKNRHREALQCLGEVLKMVEEHKLEDSDSPAQKLCMIAVCYNNIALEHLHLRKPEEACSATQNSQRLAKMCLSYSNRWSSQFEKTHMCALASLSAMRAEAICKDKEQQELFKTLSAALYS